MSSTSTPVESTPSDTALVVGTPEHERYYYEKLERALLSHIARCTTEMPYLVMSKTWLSLGENAQKAFVDNFKGSLEYGKCTLDIENQEQIDQVVMVFSACKLIEMTGVFDFVDESDTPSSKKSKKSGMANPLLKTAIGRARLERQNQ